MKNTDYLEEYKVYLMEEEKSPATIASYTIDIQGFFNYIKKDIKKTKKTDLISYKDYLKQRKLKTSSINRKLVGVRRFIEFINDKYDLAISARVKHEKSQKQYSLRDEEVLTEDDYKRLIEAVEKAGDLRTKALFETMYYSGMRISEALQLRVDHVRPIKKGITIEEDIIGKGNKSRPIFINVKLMNSLIEYLEVRKIPFSSTKDTYKELFLGERGPITRQAAHQLMKKYAKLAGIETVKSEDRKSKAHVHNLRHLFGLRLAAKGKPIEEIAKLMGHTNMETTRIYLEKPLSYYVGIIDEL